MKHIFLVGKFNNFFSDLNKELSKYFTVQLCSDNLELLKGILKMKRPNIIIISAGEPEERHQELFAYLSQEYGEIPTVCIGNQEELDFIADFPGVEKMRKVRRPVLVSEIVNTVNKGLGVSAKDDTKNEISVEQRYRVPDKKTILLVDDAGIQLRTMESILKKKYKVEMATSGKEAIMALKEKRPDLILLDYDMPGCDGRATFEMIQDEENGKDVPVVFVTGVSDRKRIMAVLKLKPAGYLIKPVKQDDLIEMVKQVLEE